MITPTAVRRVQGFARLPVHAVGRPGRVAHVFVGALTVTGRVPSGKTPLCAAFTRALRQVGDEWLRPLCARCRQVVERSFPELPRDDRAVMPVPDPAVLEAAVAAAPSVEVLDSIDFEATIRQAPCGNRPEWLRELGRRREQLRATPSPFPQLRKPGPRNRLVAYEQHIASKAAERRAYNALARSINASSTRTPSTSS